MTWNGYLVGRFEADKNGIKEHDSLAEGMPVFAIFEASPEQILQDLDKMMDDVESLMRELEEVD